MKLIKEIRKVGLIDWLWFVIVLRRDEFSHKLDIKVSGKAPDLTRLVRDRDRAHRIDFVI